MAERRENRALGGNEIGTALEERAGTPVPTGGGMRG